MQKQQDIFFNEDIAVSRVNLVSLGKNNTVPFSNYQIVISTGSLCLHFCSS